MTSNLHGICDSKGGRLRLHLREGQGVTAQLFWLSGEQVDHIRPLFTKGTSEQARVVRHQAPASPVSTGLSKSSQSLKGACSDVPKERGGKRVDDRKVLCGIFRGIQRGLGWVDSALLPMVPTKPSTTVAAAGETRVFLI